MVGLENFAEVKTLVEKRVIAGIFITDQTCEDEKPRISPRTSSLQEHPPEATGLRRTADRRDQEGGYVSRNRRRGNSSRRSQR